jgi:multidrug resistance efflux pump
VTSRESHEKQIEIDLEAATEHLGRLEALVKEGETGAQAKADALEHAIEKLRARLKEVEMARQKASGELKDGVDEAWGEMRNAMRKAGRTLGGEGT